MPNSINVTGPKPDNMPRLDQGFFDNTSAKPNFAGDVDELTGEPTKCPRLDEESFDYHRRSIDQGLASEMIDRYGFDGPRVPTHVDRMEYLIETRQTNLMEGYLDFVTSPDFSQKQPSLNHAEISILQAMAAHGILLDSNNYRIANDEDSQEERLKRSRGYLAQADESLLTYEHLSDPAECIGDKIDQIKRYKDEVSKEIKEVGLRGNRLGAYAVLVERQKKSEEDEVKNDLELAGRPPQPKLVRQPVSQVSREDFESAA